MSKNENKINLSSVNRQPLFTRATSAVKHVLKKLFVKSDHQVRAKDGKFKKGSGGLRDFSRLRWARIIPLILFVSILGGLWVFRSLALTPNGVYANWFWNPPTNGYNSLQHKLVIHEVTQDAPYFWSHQFKFIGGDGGYIGLQSRGNRVNKSVGKTAVFSIFGSGMATNSEHCSVERAGFDGYNTSGTSCRIPYEWVKGRTYTMRTKMIKSDSTGKWWEGFIKDGTTGVETSIGQIKVPASWKGHSNWSVMWTEYFGSQKDTCGAIPYSRVSFYTPVANGSIRPASKSTRVNTNSICKNTSTAGISGGVTQSMGNSAYQGAFLPAPPQPPAATNAIIKVNEESLRTISPQPAPSKVYGVDEFAEGQQYWLINTARNTKGLKSVTNTPCMSKVARNWSRTMVRENNFRHNPDLVKEIQASCNYQWLSYAENIGYGSDSIALFNAFQKSTDHNKHIINNRFNVLGLGSWRDSKGRLYMTQIFMYVK